jgi:vancomycin permeability regulator SanA
MKKFLLLFIPPIFLHKNFWKIITVFSIWLFTHLIIITYDGLTDELPANQADLIVILGNTVQPDGKMSPRLQARTERGLQLYQQGKGKKIMVSGGIGRECQDEAETMKTFLVQKGVPIENILIDNKGKNSHLTAVNTKAIFETDTSYKNPFVIVVSQYYHLSRTKLAMKQLKIPNVYSAHAYHFERRDAIAILREFAGYYVYLWKYN